MDNCVNWCIEKQNFVSVTRNCVCVLTGIELCVIHPELVTDAGVDNGRFLVRTRDNHPGDYVLCVAYKERCTNHLVTKNDEGVYIVNKSDYCGAKTIKQVSIAAQKSSNVPHGMHANNQFITTQQRYV